MNERPQETELFGHIINPNYIPPANDNFLDEEVDQPQQQQQQPDPQVQQEVLNAVFLQMENPQGEDAQVNARVAEELVQEVLEPERAQHASPSDQVFEDIEGYVAEHAQGPSDAGEGPSARDKGKKKVDESSSESGWTTADDEDDGDDDYDEDDDNDDGPDVSKVAESSSGTKRARTEEIVVMPIIEEEEEEREERLERRKRRREEIQRPTSPIQDPQPSPQPEIPTIPSTNSPRQSTPPPPTEPVQPSTSEPTELQQALSRISELEAEVIQMRDHMAVHDKMIYALREYTQLQSTLLNSNKSMLEILLKKVASNEDESCRGDELRHKSSNDKDDDPSGAKEGEQPTGTSTLNVQTTAQGESSKAAQGSGSGKGVMEADDTIEALIGLDTIFDEDDEDMGNEREEGVIPTDVEDWKPDDAVLSDQEADVDEHIVIQQSKTDVVIDTVGGEMFVDLSDLQNPVEEENVENNEESEEASRNELKKSWFKKLEKTAEPSYKTSVEASGSDELKKGIISWFYDSKLKLFIIKRFDGLQYLENKLKTFSSLPKCELKELAWKRLVNIGDDPYAGVMERIIRREGRSNNFDLLKPSIGKRVSDTSKIDPRTNRPWMRMYYKPVKCLKKVPLKKMPQNVLKQMKWWYVDCETGEAVMEDKDEKDILRIYDHLHLANLSKDDLLVLNANPMFSSDFWRHEKRRYQRVVRVCIEKGLHAGSELYS